MKKIISVLLSVLFISALFSGCKDNDKQIDLIYPFFGKINSYDPQVASTADEYLLIENCFEGLVRTDDNGNIHPGCASSWDISSDGLTYTFHLQKGLKWHVYDEALQKFGEDYNPEITANDFVFALRRAADKSTNSPLFPTISSIVNAPKIHAGSMKKSSLGVTAVDNYTLRIKLSSSDAGFLQALSTAVAMPCNEKFFNSTNGRYGLTTAYTMFNGQFRLKTITDNSYILKNNTNYAGPSPAKAADVTLKIVGPDESLASQLISGYYDAAYLRGYESTEINGKKGITAMPYSNITWALTMNSAAGGLLEYKNARRALTLSLSEPNFENYPYLTNAKGIIPPTCTVNDKPFTEQSSAVAYSPNHQEAVSVWKETAKTAGIYSEEFILLAPSSMEDVAKELVQGIQKSICAISNINNKKTAYSIKLEIITESELKAKVYSGDYDIALYPFESTASSPVSFLKSFSAVNLTGFDADSFNKAIASAESAGADKLVSACNKCERELINSFCYAPLFYESNYYTMAKNVSNVSFHAGTGRVSFVYATRKS